MFREVADIQTADMPKLAAPKVNYHNIKTKPSDLSEQECKALIEVLELRNRLSDMQQEAIYFRGCYDSVGYLKKAGIL